jgi:hypothetical protein
MPRMAISSCNRAIRSSRADHARPATGRGTPTAEATGRSKRRSLTPVAHASQKIGPPRTWAGQACLDDVEPCHAMD